MHLFLFSTHFLLLGLILNKATQTSCLSPVTATQNDESTRSESNKLSAPLPQLNCTSDPSVCNNVCNEVPGSLTYSSTFCDQTSGICVCDCRDSLRKDCEETPFTACFQDCVRKNPNPDVFLYKGGDCPMPRENSTLSYQCACGCSVRDDYEETNDVF